MRGSFLKIREVNDFQSLKKDWNILLKRNLLGDNVFLTWEWLSTSWKHFGEGRKLLLLVVEDKGEVLAIAPLMLSKYRLPVFGKIKKVEFLGVRHSDYNNFIILRKDKACLRLIVDYLMDAAEWDWIELKEIPVAFENASRIERLFSDASFNLNLKKRVCNVCPYILLPTSFDLLMKRLKKNMRQNLNKYLRRISEKYRVELKRYDEAGLKVKEAMEVFLDLHNKRWASKGLPGSFKSKNFSFLNFHMEVAECFADKGWLGLYFLLVDDESVAAQYNFEYDGKMYYYLAGFDPQYSRYSVGNLLTRFLLERCIRKGFVEYDMMRGNEAYKLFWTSTCRKNLEIRLVRKGLSKKFYSWLTWSDAVNSLAEKLKLSLKKDSVK
jgi:CelD/BcsL family acetyltransferase involved in cellulose biosynthesis